LSSKGDKKSAQKFHFKTCPLFFKLETFIDMGQPQGDNFAWSQWTKNFLRNEK
jgi:hypothetical protein